MLHSIHILQFIILIDNIKIHIYKNYDTLYGLYFLMHLTKTKSKKNENNCWCFQFPNRDAGPIPEQLLCAVVSRPVTTLPRLSVFRGSQKCLQTSSDSTALGVAGVQGAQTEPDGSVQCSPQARLVCCTLHVERKSCICVCNARKTEAHSQRQE